MSRPSAAATSGGALPQLRCTCLAAACATLLAALVLAQDVALPASTPDPLPAPEPVVYRLENVPDEGSCWAAVSALVAGGEVKNQATGGSMSGVEALSGCTAQSTTDPNACCSLAMHFGIDASHAGCFCRMSFLREASYLITEHAKVLLGLDLDFMLWKDICLGLGYPIPAEGNAWCPSSSESPTVVEPTILCEEPSSQPASVAEADALLQLFPSNMSAPASWTPDNHVCCWEGIICNTDERVTNVDLGEHVNPSGTLPEAISSISHLQVLKVVKGNLSGTLPSSWSTMSNLNMISMPEQRISGTLPEEFSALRQLRSLVLSGNQLTGTLPQSYTGFLNPVVQLSSNRLTGTLPAVWSAMGGTRQILLGDNDLSGTLPPEWSTMAWMTFIGLGKNRKLHGTLPPDWSHMTQHMTGIIVADGQLEGTLPSQWSTMSTLQVLWLGEQYFTGTVPSEWSVFSGLHHLSLKSNLLTGSLPPEWSALHLNTFHVSNNWLNGSLPDCWAADAGPDYLTEGYLDFRLNYFSGAPDSYTSVGNMYNCLPGVNGQQMCPEPWLPVAMLAVMLLCLCGTLVLYIMARGWRALLADLRFSAQRAIRLKSSLHFTKSGLLLLATLLTLAQKLYILSPLFSMHGLTLARVMKPYLAEAARETVRLLSGTLLSMLNGLPTIMVVVAFVWRGALSLVPFPELLPSSLNSEAWTLVASEDVLKDNLQALKVDQLLLLGMFSVMSLLVPLVVSLGLPEVIITREVDPSSAWGVGSSIDKAVYLPRDMLAVLTASFIMGIYSMLAAVLLPCAVVWPSLAVNQAVHVSKGPSQAHRGLRQLRRLRWAFPQALLSLVLCAAGVTLFVVSDWHIREAVAGGMGGLVWGTRVEATVIILLASLQLLCVWGWNLSVWGSTFSSQETAVDALCSGPDEEAVLSSQPSESSCNANDDDATCVDNSCRPEAWDTIPAQDDSSGATMEISGEATSQPVTGSQVAAAAENPLWQWLRPQVHLIGQTRARDNALLLVIVLQMVHIDRAVAGPAVAWLTWLTSTAILCWALLITDAPKGFEDIHESAAFGLVILAKDLAAVLHADLETDDGSYGNKDSGTEGSDDFHGADNKRGGPASAFEGFADKECCAAYPAGCPRCQLLVRRFPATLFRMQETMAVSYRWQKQVRAVVRPEGHCPLASFSGLKNQVVGINMTRWQRSQLLAAITQSSCTYVWLDVLSIPAALLPAEGSRLWELSDKLMARMMAVYSAAASTLVLLSKEEENERYCQRAWTMQEYCGSRSLNVVVESRRNKNASLLRRGRTLRDMLNNYPSARKLKRLQSFRIDEVETYKELREYVRQSMTKAVPLWIRVLSSADPEIEDLEHRADLYASVMDNVHCSQPVDRVRALVPVLMNTSVQNMDELRLLVRVASNKCSPDSEGAQALQRARSLLGIDAAIEAVEQLVSKFSAFSGF